MKDLSIIIVSYNVRDFLLQCLDSIFKSDTSYSYEVIIVDNDSVDDSIHALKRFQEIHPIIISSNTSNLGFATANNVGYELSSGKNILLLNPDTVIAKDTIQKSLDFIEKSENIGALGVKMIDGNGHFLPESKRGFPSVSASVFKLTGLYKLAKKSPYVNAYYMGHLDENERHKVDVLCGAFMLMPSKVYEEVGRLDERYFMYGEDIDLSYQISQAGYDIWYTPDTSIIHYKGESTKKASIQYYQTFYNAMLLFVEKNFSLKGRWLGIFFKIIISLFGAFAFFKSAIRSLIHIFLDMSISFSSLFAIQQIWARFYKSDPGYFDRASSITLYASLSIIIAVSYYIFGKYDRNSGLRKILLSFGAAVLVCLVTFSLLPAYMRNSRPVLLLALLLMFPMHLFTKALYNYFKYGFFSLSPVGENKVLLLAQNNERETILALIPPSSQTNRIVGVYTSDHFSTKSIVEIISDLKNLDLNEIIFSSQSIDFGSIIAIISSLGDSYKYKITSRTNEALIGPGSSQESPLFALEYQMKLSDPMHRRLKYIVNLFLTIICVPILPIAVFRSEYGVGIFKEWLYNLCFVKFWVGYDENFKSAMTLPSLLPCSFTVSSSLGKKVITDSEINRVNLYYAKDYSMLTDIEIFIKNIV